jgi:hypothetical protein
LGVAVEPARAVKFVLSTSAREHMTFRALKIENMGLFPPETVDQRLDRDTVEDQIAFGYFCSIRHGNPEKS